MKSKTIQIFKPGKHVAMSGAALSFSESDLAATAAAYDPAKHEAPLVVGHPKTDGPAYGWVKSLAFAGTPTSSGRADGALEAVPHQVDPAFAEMVARGAFKKISASFYAPDSPSNPVPGVYYLRHVGLLGAQPPAVKGLRNPQFADTEQGVVEFSEWDDADNASLWRSLREWVLGKFGQDEADKAVPGYQVKSLEQGAQDELRAAQTESTAGAYGNTPAPAFVEPQPKGEAMSDADKARLAALETENAALKAKETAFADADKKRAADARHAGHIAFAEGLVREGKLLPANKGVAVATMDILAAPLSPSPQPSPQGGGGEGENHLHYAEFGEGDAKQPLLAAFKSFLQAHPKLVEFGEAAGAGKDAPATVEFAAPQGYTVDAGGMELHGKAIAYLKAHPDADYVSAVQAVSQ